MDGGNGITVQAIADSHGCGVEIDESVGMYILLGDNDGPWLYDLEYVSKRDGKPVLCVCGNHDDPSFPLWHPSFAYDGYCEYEGIRFCLVGGCLRREGETFPGDTQEGYFRRIGSMPECDVLVSHAPPYGIYEPCDFHHRGIRALAEKIRREEPLLCLYGHMHTRRTDVFGKTTVRGIYMSERLVVPFPGRA